MISRTNSKKSSSFSTRSGLALLASSMFLISACGPTAPRELPVANGAFPQQVVDSSGNPVAVSGYDLSAVQAADWTALRGNYGGALYYYSDRQDYTVTLTEKTLEGRRFAYAEFRSTGEMGETGVGMYMYSEPISSWGGRTRVRFTSSVIPVDEIENWNWVPDPVVLVMEFDTTTQTNGSKTFDPTQSTIYILDCAVSPGTANCSNVYPYEIAGFESLGRR